MELSLLRCTLLFLFASQTAFAALLADAPSQTRDTTLTLASQVVLYIETFPNDSIQMVRLSPVHSPDQDTILAAGVVRLLLVDSSKDRQRARAIYSVLDQDTTRYYALTVDRELTDPYGTLYASTLLKTLANKHSCGPARFVGVQKQASMVQGFPDFNLLFASPPCPGVPARDSIFGFQMFRGRYVQKDSLASVIATEITAFGYLKPYQAALDSLTAPLRVEAKPSHPDLEVFALKEPENTLFHRSFVGIEVCGGDSLFDMVSAHGAYIGYRAYHYAGALPSQAGLRIGASKKEVSRICGKPYEEYAHVWRYQAKDEAYFREYGEYTDVWIVFEGDRILAVIIDQSWVC